LKSVKAENTDDILEIVVFAAVWRELLAAYSVKTTSDKDDPQEMASIDKKKTKILKCTFWDIAFPCINKSPRIFAL
jgi:hypothetical protein